MTFFYQVSNIRITDGILDVITLPPSKDIQKTIKQYRELLEIRLSHDVSDISWFDHCQDWYENIHEYKIVRDDILFDFEKNIHKIKPDKSNNLTFLINLNILLSCGNMSVNDFILTIKQFLIKD